MRESGIEAHCGIEFMMGGGIMMVSRVIRGKLGRHISMVVVFFCFAGFAFPTPPVNAEPFLGEVICGGWNFCPKGWADCSGQFLPIAYNTALFSLLGTTYGGNGTTTFALPNLQSRTIIHAGQGPGLNSRTIGETGGVETVTLTRDQIPAHIHSVSVNAGPGNAASPTDRVIASSPAADSHFTSGNSNTTMASSMVSVAGGSQPHNNLQPYLAVKCCIALIGIFPSHN